MKRTKKINRSRIMQEIWLNREISRSEIAKNLRLDKSTISNNINELLQLGIIIEAVEGEAGPQGGRKPIILKMNQNYGCVLGLEMRTDSYNAAAVDLEGEVLYSRFEKIDIKQNNLIEVFIGIVKMIHAELECKGIKLLGVGLGLSGVVNAKDGRLKYSIPFGIKKEMDFCRLAEDKIDVPVFMDNDANACVWGELAFHRRKDLRDCLFILLENLEQKEPSGDGNGELISVGIGLVINGNVHYGYDYSAGEFRSVFRQKGSVGQFSLTSEEQALILSNADIKKRFLHELGANISLLVNTFNLTHIILGGEFEQLGNDVVSIFEEEIRENWPYTHDYDVKKQIWFSSFGDKAVAYGAGGMVLNKLFSDLEILDEYTGHLEVQSNAGII